MGDIRIPKSSFGAFITGVIAVIIVFGLIGIVGAATVFNAGGGTIANVAEPSANSDAATKNYVDTNAGISTTWVSLGTTSCNSGRCYYNLSITGALDDDHDGDTTSDITKRDATIYLAHYICTSNGYDHAVDYKWADKYSASTPNCYYRSSNDNWLSVSCEPLGRHDRYQMMDKVLCAS